MNNKEFKLRVRNELLKLKSSSIVSPSQITVRCPFCGDSLKDLSHAHFNIKINVNENEPIMVYCFRCDIGGILTPSILRTLKINDLSLNSSLISYNKNSMGTINKTLGLINNNLEFSIPIPNENDSKTMLKKKYIEYRLGMTFTIEELIKMKVVFNLGEFLKVNNINSLTTNKEKASLLHKDYVGFLTAKNEFINFRDITGNNKRYEKYNVYKNLDNTRKFYSIPNEINLMATKNITINIAEGVFDVLGIYYHLYEKENDNMIYTAVCGAGYISVLKYYIKMGVFGNVTINIYSDNDRVPQYYYDLKNELIDWVDSINLFYNDIGKDYGVPKDKIKIKKKKL